MTADTQLLAVAAGSIGLVVLLISVLRMPPFLALTISALMMALGGGLDVATTTEVVRKGAGSTLGGVGLVLAFGAMLGRLLVVSGGATAIAATMVDRVGYRMAPWAMAALASLIGLPLFFEVGVVVMIPIIFAVAERIRQDIGSEQPPYILVGLPALAGLSVMHGLVPPHPGPLVAVEALGADMGLTLAFGLIVALPTVILSGPVFAAFAARWATAEPPVAASTSDQADFPAVPRTNVSAATAAMMFPVVLMLGRTLAELTLPPGDNVRSLAALAGEPSIALLLSILVSIPVLGLLRLGRIQVAAILADSLPPIAGIVFIIGAGGAFKQALIETGVGDAISGLAAAAAVPPLLLGWAIAALVRLATGSATVATITAAALMVPMAQALAPEQLALLVLAIGAGSVIFSHVNDAGFWMIKEFFGMSVTHTLKTWSLMETIISVCGLAGVMAIEATL